jgi:2-keto-4-pentenoate hydratase/2-oxohepta-3-ene-1,7-dioic acid hydratase in catechol pathway
MKLATVAVAGRATWGIIDGDMFLDVGSVLGAAVPDLKSAIAMGLAETAGAAAATAPRHPVAGLAFLPVIPNPDKILCIGLNYESHRRETGRAEVGNPTIFLRVNNSQVGHQQPILRPRVSTHLDYEGELAVIIGKGGRYISRDGAFAHIAGYACYNDGSLRDWQRHTHQFTPGKNFPDTGAFGPWMVTADEIPDVEKLHLTTRLNGAVVQEAGLDQLIFTIPHIIEYCSAFTRLEPGDVIPTGTPGGVGFKRDPQLFMKPGDVVEIDIPGIGRLVNPIADEPANPQ